MKNLTMPLITSAAVLAAVTWANGSFADDTFAEPPAPHVSAEETTVSPPNAPLLGAGLVTLAGAYVPAVIVAAASNTSYDNRLYLPVVGPWLDLGDRPGCGGFGQHGCGAETGSKALLIIDGAFQGLGAVATVLGLMTPQSHTTMVTAKADAVEK
ncbi:MAG: hypothetical protein ACREJ3_05130, partial [Polyangiaceae bacterium]